MRQHRLRTLIGAASAAALVTLGLPAPAQRRPVPPPGARSVPAIPTMLQAEQLLYGPSGRLDPTRSNAALLFRREDVRFELNLTRRQWGQLEDLQSKAQAGATGTQNNAPNPAAPGESGINAHSYNAPGTPQNTPNAAGSPTQDDQNARTPQARRQQMQRRMELMRQRMATSNPNLGELDPQTAAILTPAQLKRLHEIDLQWRGPMAMADPKLAEEMNLTQDQRVGVDTALQNYRVAQTRALQAVQAALRETEPSPMPRRPINNPNGPIVVAPSNNTSRPQMSPAERMQAAQQTIEEARAFVTKAYQTAGDKVLALLTPTQRTHWHTLTGKPMRS